MSDRAKLIEYAKQTLRIQCRPGEAVAVTVEQIVSFAELLRAGCHQDILRLIPKFIKDLPPGTSGADALKGMAYALEGQGTESWGCPDCSCDEATCVYCGPRIARRATAGGQ